MSAFLLCALCASVVHDVVQTGRARKPVLRSANPVGDLLAIDEALTVLAEQDAESAQLVKLRFYAGLSVEEAADVMGLARASAYRTWTFAKAWLRARLGGKDTD